MRKNKKKRFPRFFSYNRHWINPYVPKRNLCNFCTSCPRPNLKSRFVTSRFMFKVAICDSYPLKFEGVKNHKLKHKWKSNMHNLHITFWTSSKTELVASAAAHTCARFAHVIDSPQLEVEFFDIKLSFYSKSFIFDEFRCFAVNFFWPQLRHREWYVQNLHIPHSFLKSFFASLACKIGIFLIVQAELAQMKELGWQNRSQFATGRFELSSIPW